MIHLGCGGEWDREGDLYVCFDCKKELRPSELCESCGAEITFGQWPWCPHEKASNFGEDPLEPYYDGELEAEITTRAGRRAIMAEKHLEYHDVSKKRRGRLYIDLHR